MAANDAPDFDGKDVLKRAHEILSAGPLPEGACGDYCPWCAIAEAKSQLDKEHGSGLDLWGVVIYWDVETPADRPLVEARMALSEWNNLGGAALTKEEALAILESAWGKCKVGEV